MKVRTNVGVLFALSPLLLSAALVSACVRTRAQVSPEPPALDVPLPPSRVIATTSAEAPPAVGTPSAVGPSGLEELNRSNNPAPPSGSTGRQAQTKPPEAPKPETPAADLPKAPEEPRVATSPLQTTPPQREGEVENAIRQDMTRAWNKLNGIDYQRLNPDAKAQYDIAKGNLLQAEPELKAKNFPAAKNLVEKAVALAAQLPGR